MKAKIKDRLEVGEGDLVMFVGDKEAVVCDALGALRVHLAGALKLYRNWWDEKAEHDAAEDAKKVAAEKKKSADKYTPAPYRVRPDQFSFAWVVDFPMFAHDAEENRWIALHHPFTSPRDEDVDRLESDPGLVQAKAYDLVLNGYEVGGGSIRIHSPDVQARVFGMLGMSPEDARSKFGFLLDALQSGAPPHGGIALGLDRWCMMLAGTSNIRDVIAFPKNQKARDVMTGAPATVEPRQLRDLGIKLS